MSQMTKMALHTLQHENTLTVEEIMPWFPMAPVLVRAAGVFVRALPALCVPRRAVPMADLLYMESWQGMAVHPDLEGR